MGNFLNYGKGRAIKSFKNYNIDSRVENIMKKPKQKLAPRHEITSTKFSPNISERLARGKINNVQENEASLLKNLKSVYVTSVNKNPEFEKEEFRKKLLPSARGILKHKSYGYFQANKSKYGKISLEDMLKLLTKYQEDTEKNTHKILADDYNIDSAKLEKVLKYYFTFTLIVPYNVQEVNDSQSIVLVPPPGTTSTVLLEDYKEVEDEEMDKKLKNIFDEDTTEQIIEKLKKKNLKDL